MESNFYNTIRVSPYVLFSGVLYGLSFVCSWGSTLCMVCALFLLVYVQLYKSYTARDGFVWGLSAFFIHTFPLFCILAPVIKGIYSFSCGWIVLLLYASLYAAVWFWCVNKILNFITHALMRCSVIALSGAFFFWWMCSSFLWVFDVQEGYTLLNPLLLFIHFKSMQLLVSSSGIWFTLWLVIFCIAMLCTLIQKHYFLISLIILGFFWCFLYFPPWCINREFPQWLSSIVCIVPPFNPSNPLNCYTQVSCIIEAVYKVRQKYPTVCLIIMPESAFPFTLNMFCDLQEALKQVMRDVMCIAGGHYKEKEKIFNSCYLITENSCYPFYHKKHRVIFLERLPSRANNAVCKGWFLKDSFCFSSGTTSSLIECSGGSFFPLICSDIFCGRITKCEKPLLCLVNDGWFKGTLIPDLLYRCAVMAGIASHNSMLYITHTRACYIDHHGESISLPLIFA